MRSNRLRTWGLVAVVAGAPGPKMISAEPQGAVIHRTSAQSLREPEPESNIASISTVTAIELPQPLDASDVSGWNTAGGVAAPPFGSTQVYRNEINPVANIYAPGPNQRMADDLTLANGACNAVYYNLRVYGTGAVGVNYNVHTELWNGEPCLPGSTVIAGTANDFVVSVPSTAQRASLLEFTLAAPTPVPATVWMAVTFSTNTGTWIVAQQAELGSTLNFFSENDTDPNPDVCTLYNFQGGSPWAGFWANVYCETVVPPTGACCNGTNCTQTTEANCIAPSMWQGAFTPCQPNSCLSGACCTGVELENCADTNEPGCQTGLFRPGGSCEAVSCGQSFLAYENDFRTGIFDTIDTNTKWADDLTLGSGPCDLIAYEVLMAGDGTPPAPPTFNTHVELWTNNENNTPMLDSDDTPLAVIPGTQRDFNGLAANLSAQRLLAGPFISLPLPRKVWMVLTTSSNKAGPNFGGEADVGFSQDGFRIFNDPSAPGAWSTTLFDFGGFNPTGCPYVLNDPNTHSCTPAGSFRAIVWCEGDPPTGACCNDNNGTCTDDVLAADCEGRWMEGVTCASNPFSPPCGVHACCFPNPINPNSIVCQNLTPEDCSSLEGSSAPGLFCVGVPVCPGPACINKPGDCFLEHATGGCENAFCCDKVCAVDPFCCSTDWDSTCVMKAREMCSSDQCDDALPITGTGTFQFNNTTASTDGPAHSACPGQQIENDVWYCWTAPCTDTVYVRTCGQTTVDTKLAVYEGCGCPPEESGLLDCSDDRCGLQSTAVFHAVAGRSYMIRVGNYPGQLSGSGSLTITCGPPDNAGCPMAGGCCTAENPPIRGCVNEACCERVCGCDSYCCDIEWDDACATTGDGGSGCGADLLCPVLCGNCPTGAVTFNNPASGLLDARRPHVPGAPTQPLGIDTIQISAPFGADKLGCWTLCETASTAAANGISEITDDGGGQYTIHLARPITPGAVTKITYAGNGAFARYIFHPANINTDGFSNSVDITAFVNALNGTTPMPAGLLSGDVNFSGAVTGADLLDLVGLLNGQGFASWNNTAKPVGCP